MVKAAKTRPGASIASAAATPQNQTFKVRIVQDNETNKAWAPTFELRVCNVVWNFDNTNPSPTNTASASWPSIPPRLRDYCPEITSPPAKTVSAASAPAPPAH